jgi:hypothetical protein
MKLKLTPIVFALCAALPLTAQAAPTVAFVAPTSGQTISGNLYQSSACEVKGANIGRVVFYLDSTQLNTETGSPWNCNLDTRNFSNGSHTLRARAYDAEGTSITTTQITVNIQNGTTSGGTSGGSAPTVSFTAPSNGATITSAINQSSACEVTGSGISKVQFYLGTTALNSEGSAPWQCNIDPSKFAAGTYPLKAVASSSTGAMSTAQISVNIGSSSTGGSTTTGPTVSFKTPSNGATITSPIYQSSGCEALVASSTSMKQVQFYLGSTLLNTEGGAPWNCNIDPAKFAAGTYPLKAVATDTTGGIGSAQISVNIGTGGTTAPAGPTVSFKTPANGATISKITGHSDGGCEALTTALSGTTVKQVQFYLGSTLINTEGLAPWTCLIDPSKFTSGTHTLKAVATDDKGGTGTAQVSINIQNDSTAGGDTSGGTGGGDTAPLPSTDTKAVPTFASLGLYWKPPSNPGTAGCEVRYRKTGESSWKQALAMWYDSRNSECRGSIVNLAAGSEYEVQFAMPGKSPSAGLKARTWSENFPIAKTVQVQSGSQTLNITEGGTASGYVLYTGPATRDAGDAQTNNVVISASYVIVRGLTLKGAKQDAVSIKEGATNVVIEGNDISGWGRYSRTNSEGWKIGMNKDAGIATWCNTAPSTKRVIIQRNKIHHPRYGANSWSEGHPLGPNAFFSHDCGGEFVIRYNEIYSDWGRYFNDAIGGESNFSDRGVPNADSDIYGNRISHAWDDGIEAEGANRNVRIWGNYLDNTATGIATTATHIGPVYVFRNVQNRSRMYSQVSLDQDSRNGFAKSGSTSSYGNGRRYVFHNTTLQAVQSGAQYPLGVGNGLKGNSNQPMTNTVSRNNIYHVWKSWWPSIIDNGGAGNDLDHDLVNGSVSAYSGAEANRAVGTPIYQSGHGWQSEANGQYQLAPNSPGYGRGAKIPNFNDGVTAPDMGAHQSGASAMKFGVR